MENKYKETLLSTASNLDAVSHSNGKITDFCIKIVDDYDEHSILQLLSYINLLLDNTSFSQKEKTLINNLIKVLNEQLCLFIGYEKVSNLSKITFTEQNEKSLETLQKELNSFVGLSSVKKIINDLIIFQKVQKIREDNGLPKSKKTMHMAFIGNPGTGKTSVARIVGRMYKQIGVLSKGHFIEVSRTDLIAGYQGQTALKVKKVIQEAKGGVLFIDEAYSLTENSNSDSYGRECLTELTKALEDYRDDLVVIVAGYKEPMKQFFESNPGLKSRFNTFIYFENYTASELVSIFEKICSDEKYTITNELKVKLESYFSEQLNNNKEEFSNGRCARNFFDLMILNQSKRIVDIKKPTTKILKELTLSDFEKSISESSLYQFDENENY